MQNKTFRQSIEFFESKLKNGDNFTLSKYADGEWAVIKNVPINNKEFWFNPNDQTDQEKRSVLIESFQYKNLNYYVGISCPCCQGIDTFNEMYEFSNQDEENLTWANIWVNSNYSYYVENIIPIFQEREIIIFCNELGDIKNLPFVPRIVFPVKNNAWQYNWKQIEMAKTIISANNIKNNIFLFCCGPFGNILAYELTKYCPDNVYLDIGSTLNPWLKSAGFERHYYMGNNIFSNLTCLWGNNETR